MRINNKSKYPFENLIYTEGLPCHKFILKSLTSINDAKVFTKNYVTTMRSAGINDSDIESSLMFFSGIAKELEGRYDFSSWDKHIEGFSLIDDILFDNEVAAFKTCRQYYKKMDSKCSACVLCPISAKYKNANMNAEKNVVMYALSSRENLSYILSKGVTIEQFVSVTDITARKAVALKPCAYPFYKNTMAALTDPVICEDIFMFNGDYEPVLERYHSKKIGRMSSIEKDCSFSVNTFCAVMISDMLSGEPCSKTEIDTYIEALFPNPGKDLSSVMDNAFMKENDVLSMDTSCNLGLDEMSTFYEPSSKVKPRKKRSNSGSPAPSTTDKKAAKHIESAVDKSFVSVTLDSIMSKISEFDENEPVIGEANTSSSLPEQLANDMPTENISTTEYVHKNIPDERIESFKEDETILTVPKEYSLQNVPSVFVPLGTHLPYKNSHEEPVSAQILISEINLPDELYALQNDDMAGIPLISESELQHFALNLDSGNSHLLSLFESHVYKDKKLSLEIVCVSESNFYLLIYSPRLHAYFYTKCGNIAVKEIITPILSHRSIEKFCYYPYALVSVLRKMNLRIRSLYSLFSMSRIYLGNHSMSMSMVLDELGAVKAIGGITVRAEGDITSIPLLYMHCYHNIYYRTKRHFLKHGAWNEYSISNTYDIVLGLSYFQNIYSMDNEFLFKLKTANGYVFRSKAPFKYQYPGKRFCITLKYIPEGQETIMLNLLCEMYEKGMFYNTGLLLLSMNQNFMSMYIIDKDVEYVETRINRLLLSLLNRTQSRGMEYYIAELKGSELFTEK